MNIKKNKGFTILELFIVMAIVAVVAAVAMPYLLAYIDNSNLKEAARDLSSDIYYWKQRTVTDSKVYRIKMNAAAKSYTIQQETATDSGVYNDLETKDIAGGSKSVDVDAETNITYVTFNTRGTSTAGKIVLLHKRRGSKATITVNTMGRVKVEYELKS